MKDTVLFILCLLIPLLIVKPHKATQKERQGLILTYIIFVVGFAIRVLFVDKYPMGLNQDEASAGYDAYAILKYGIDRNGNFLPMHLVAWGSGQNALYSYLCMPFIALFGLNEFAIRLPMGLIGCMSLVVMYKLLKEIKGEQLARVGLFLYAIMPWHIMKSRWALEGNIFPDFILLGVLLLVMSIKRGSEDKRRRVYYYLAFVVMGVSSYAYGTSYYFLFIFVVASLAYLFYQKQINLKEVIGALGTMAIVCFPIMLFLGVNTFGWEQINLPFMTIPKMKVARYGEITSIFSGDFLEVSKNNLKAALGILIKQEDGLPWNAISFYGITYIFSLPFLIVGLCTSFWKEKKDKEFSLDFLMHVWFFTSVSMLLIVSPNINRISILFIPVMYYIIRGVYVLLGGMKQVKYGILITYAICFLSFGITYFTTYQEQISGYFFYSFGDAIKYTKNLDVEKVYVAEWVNAPYVFALFYDQEDPQYYLDTVEYSYKDVAFEQIRAYGKYRFYTPEMIDRNENAAYIVPNHMIGSYEEQGFNVQTFAGYSVAW